MFPYKDSKTESVCSYLKKRNHFSFVNISSTLVIIDTSMERSSRELEHRNPEKIILFLKKVEIEFWLVFWFVPRLKLKSS